MAKAKKKEVVVVAEVTLKEIVEATLDSAKGFLYTSSAVHTPLIEAGFVEVNAALSNEAGELATRATEKGMQQMSNTKPEENAAVNVGGFVIETGVALPSISGRGRATGASKYPFDKLEVGQSFFVPASEALKDPAKTLASTVARANAHYSEVVEGEVKTNRKGNEVPVRKPLRQFVVRSVEGGARIWRTL